MLRDMKLESLHTSRLFAIILFSALALPLLAQKEGPERWEKTIREFEKADRANPPQPGGVLFTGSSSIALWKDIASYFPEHRVLNRGFGGSNFSDLLYYAERVIMPYQPTKIFIYEGDNDITQGDSPDQILANARQLRTLIREKLGDTPVVFISPKPSVARWQFKETYEAVNRALKAYAESEPNTEFADVWTPALDNDGNVKKDIFVKDNLHLNAKGYEIWQQVLSKYLPEK
jgi:lysophospholipase L1-like esterase